MGSLILRGELPRTAGTRPSSVPGTYGARGPNKTPFPWLTGQGCRTRGIGQRGRAPGDRRAAKDVVATQARAQIPAGPFDSRPLSSKRFCSQSLAWGKDNPYPRLRPRSAQGLPWQSPPRPEVGATTPGSASGLS